MRIALIGQAPFGAAVFERLVEDRRWNYGVPPKRNANLAWVQHMAHHLAPKGVAGFVLANGSMSSSQSGEGKIRKNWGRYTIVPKALFMGLSCRLVYYILSNGYLGI